MAGPLNVRGDGVTKTCGHRRQQRRDRAAREREFFERPCLAGDERAAFEIEDDVDRAGRSLKLPLNAGTT
jgi:hypothetical protein